MQKIKLKIIDKAVKNENYYVLTEISIRKAKSYCLIVKDSELAVEGVGNDPEKARRIFYEVSDNDVSSINADEVIRDMRTEFFL